MVQILEKEIGYEKSPENYAKFEDDFIAEKKIREKIKDQNKIILPIKPKTCKQCGEFNELVDKQTKDIEFYKGRINLLISILTAEQKDKLINQILLL